MGLLDKFRTKIGKQAHKEDNVLDLVKDEKKKEDKTPALLKEDTGRAYKILSSPHLSEKTTAFAHQGRYVFKVNDQANKIEIRKAVEKAYDVHVISVNIVNIKGKRRRTGRTMGQTSDWKKAIVTLRSGEKISGLMEGV